MEERQFMYQPYLDKFDKCPMEKCSERKVPAFRWVHFDVRENDFKINIDHPGYENRSLDESDLDCEDFALSVYKDLESAKNAYMRDYSKRKNDLAKEKFVKKKGDAIAYIQLTENDGVSDDPIENGHFSFFPYIGFNCLESIKDVFTIFAV